MQEDLAVQSPIHLLSWNPQPINIDIELNIDHSQIELVDRLELVLFFISPPALMIFNSIVSYMMEYLNSEGVA